MNFKVIVKEVIWCLISAAIITLIDILMRNFAVQTPYLFCSIVAFYIGYRISKKIRNGLEKRHYI